MLGKIRSGRNRLTAAERKALTDAFRTHHFLKNVPEMLAESAQRIQEQWREAGPALWEAHQKPDAMADALEKFMASHQKASTEWKNALPRLESLFRQLKSGPSALQPAQRRMLRAAFSSFDPGLFQRIGRVAMAESFKKRPTVRQKAFEKLRDAWIESTQG